MSEEAAITRMEEKREFQEVREQLAQVLGGNKAVPSAGAGEKSWAEKQQAILDDAGIDKNDPRIVELLRNAASKQDFLVKLEESTFAWKQADVKKPQPSSSTVAQTIPSVIPTEGAYADISSEALGDSILELHKDYTKNKAEIDARTKELARRDKT